MKIQLLAHCVVTHLSWLVQFQINTVLLLLLTYLFDKSYVSHFFVFRQITDVEGERRQKKKCISSQNLKVILCPFICET